MQNRPQAQLAHYEFEIEMRAAPPEVWRALTEATDAWWPADFRTLGPDSVVHLDPTPGGGLIERGADGSGLLWYTVQMVVPGRSLNLVGHLAPAWGGPTLSMLELKIEARGSGSLLRVSDALIGAASASKVAELESGWRQLFGQGLARYAAGSSSE